MCQSELFLFHISELELIFRNVKKSLEHYWLYFRTQTLISRVHVVGTDLNFYPTKDCKRGSSPHKYSGNVFYCYNSNKKTSFRTNAGFTSPRTSLFVRSLVFAHSSYPIGCSGVAEAGPTESSTLLLRSFFVIMLQHRCGWWSFEDLGK